MSPDPVSPAVSTITGSHQFSDLEKVLLLVLLAGIVGGVIAMWRGGAWVVKTAFPSVTDLVKQLIAGLSDLREALLASDASHARRVDDVKSEVKAVGSKVDALAASIDSMEQSVSSRLSGAEEALTQTRLDMARNGIVDRDAVLPSIERHPTGSKLRTVKT